ncbi:MAG: nucleotide exchange factor GrpE [Planctomycetota bacterium]|jgi:molecular chaperone GrpE
MSKSKGSKTVKDSPPAGADNQAGMHGAEGQQMPSGIDTIELSEEAADLIHRLEAERDEALAARTRALADYRNFQRRADENEARALLRGASGVARSIVPVLDNFDLALGQDTDQLTVEQLLAGVRLVRDELFKALEAHGVRRIEPEEGEEFDPNCHEAMFKQRTAGLAPNSVVCMLQPGYAIGELVLRPAKVAVSSGADEAGDDPAE